MRAWLRSALGALLVAAGLALAVLAVEALRWPGRASAEDRAMLGPARPESGVWTGMGFATTRLLGAGDDVALRRAIVEFRRGRLLDVGTNKDTDEIVATVAASVALGLVERDREAPLARRSLAANLDGVLLAEEAVLEPDGAPRMRRALELFRRAVLYDASNDAAKTNLQLLLALSGEFGGTGETTSGFGGFGKESGGGDPGRGY